MAFYKIKSGRVNGVRDAIQYVAPYGQIFYDDEDNMLRIGDGVTPGGTPAFIPVATSSTIGGIKLGPGVILNGSGQIIIDSEGLDFSFGDFAGTTGTYPADYYESARQDEDYAVLSSINLNEDIVFATNGTGAVRVVGDFSVRRANGNLIGALEEEPIFRVKSDGQVQMLVPSADSAEGAFTIVGGLDGVFQAPVNTGVMLHITGIASSPEPTPSRIYNDAQNSFGAFVTRRYNGTAAAPTAVLDGEEILRLSGTAHNGTLIPGTGNQRIIYKALGNQTLTNQGGTIELWTTPVNTTTIAKVATVSSTGITLESGKVLTGNIVGKHVNGVRDAGTIADAGTLTIDFATDSIVYCVWANGMTLAYSNYTAGSVVKVIARKATGSGNDTFSLGGLTAAQVSSGSTTSPNVSADTTAFIELTCTGTTIGSVYARL
jgi:hypothetical protein